MNKKVTKKDIDTLADEKLLKMLSVVDPALIVRFDKITGIITVGGKRLEEGRLKNLKAEADFFVQSDLWKLIYETPKQLAHEAMFIKAETKEQINSGKSMLFTLDTQNKIVDIFKTHVK